jgi:hypothetical protein
MKESAPALGGISRTTGGSAKNFFARHWSFPLDCFECRPQALIGSYEFEVSNSFARHHERGEMKGVECSQ